MVERAEVRRSNSRMEKLENPVSNCQYRNSPLIVEEFFSDRGRILH